MSWRITPGPLNNDLLFLSGQHRADYYFRDPESDEGILRARRGDKAFWDYINEVPITENVMRYIRLAGFAGVIECGYRKLDRALISALVERWRPETHTFHLPVGETTITLQDVQVLWGLPVEGDVVSGTDYAMSASEIIIRFEYLTGCTLATSAVSGYKLNLRFILNEIIIKPFSDNATDFQCIQRARLILFFMIGATLFPDTSSNWVHVNYLSHIENLNNCGRLSWGSAVLAFLYRQLCKATSVTNREVGGPLFLLQLWAWERLPTMCPKNTRSIDFRLPYGARWNGELSYVNTTPHCLSAYRSQLHSLSEATFNWRPYDNIIHLLPDICTSGHQSWRSDTYLICWEVVEPHIPSRVLRQFGMFQPIPTSVLLTREQHTNLHSTARKGGRNKNWLQHHNIFVQAWASRHNSIANEAYTDSSIASEAYMRWYLERTVVYTTNPAHQDTNPHGFQNDGQRLRMMMDGMSQFYQRPGDETGRNMASRYMDLAHANHISYLPTHVTQNVDETQLPPVPQRLPRRGRGRGRVGRQVGDDNVVVQQNMTEQRDFTEQQFDSPFFSQMGNQDFFYGGTSSTQFPHFSQMGTQNFEEGGPSNPYQSPDNSYQQSFHHSSPLPYYPQFQDTAQSVDRFFNPSPCLFDLNDEATNDNDDTR